MKERPDYLKIASEYCQSVLSGEVPACRWVKLACQRQVNDLKKLQEGNFPYIFDRNAASRVCWFIEHLTHVKGELAGRFIHLEPWQVFILTTVFGWLTEDGRRRYRRSYIEVPRGNGKSAMSSGVALYCLCADKEQDAEVYSFATTRDQAKIVFGDAKQMAAKNPQLRKAFGLQVLTNSLYLPNDASTFQAKSAEGSTLDGLNTHCAIIDELHAHKTRAVYDVVETSLGKRLNSLMWIITTAGFDTSGICYEVRTMVREVLEGKVFDDSQFGIIYTIDEDDDWKTEKALKKANPNWGISVRPEVVSSLQKKAIVLPSAMNNFKTKHLDVWCSASSAWMDMQAWDTCTDPSLDRVNFEGDDVFIGLDLGSKSDLTAKVLIFPKEAEDGKMHYYVFSDFYLPQRAIETSTNSQYAGWAEEGLIHVSGGAMTDFNEIEESIREDLSRFNVRAVIYDPWQATQLANSLSENDAPMVECRMTVQNLSDPMKSLEALVLDGRLHHDGNPVMNWMMGNVVAKLDHKDNIFPNKDRYENKIDGPVALIMGLGNALMGEENDFAGFVESGDVTFFEW